MKMIHPHPPLLLDVQIVFEGKDSNHDSSKGPRGSMGFGRRCPYAECKQHGCVQVSSVLATGGSVLVPIDFHLQVGQWCWSSLAFCMKDGLQYYLELAVLANPK